MSSKAIKIAEMIDMLPEQEQNLACEMLKRIVLAWDSDFTKLTPAERERLEQAEAETEVVNFDDIDWN